MNIGIDFGSTYTMVSVFEDGNLETIQPNGLTYNYPSIVAFDKMRSKYYFGSSARAKIGGKDVVVYRGFKMLLNQQMSEENLKKRGYDEVNTPEYITELFLRYIIENTLRKKGADQVEELVIGAPECWFQSIHTVDARGTLRDICNKLIDLCKEVKVISEPTNAAAFCVWNYEQEMKQAYNGNIIVIDYGGGTLDTALVSVSHKNKSMQIKPEMRSGEGENKNNEIGKAGIAYQEAVVREAICTSLGIDESKLEYNSRFNKILKSFEEQLISSSADIEEIMSEYSFNPEGLRDEIFATLEYGEDFIEINYYQLYSNYNKVIQPVLEKVLDETTRDLKEIENVHIALVGGFCNYYLVKKQIYDYFKIGTMDNRIKGMVREESEREKAIAHGAALFANHEIYVCNIAQYSIGMYATYSDGTIFNDYAIYFGQEIETDKIYFITDSEGKPCPMFASNLDKFLLNFSKDSDKCLKMRPKKIFAEKLQAVEHGFCVAIGFSVDVKERISVHVYNYDMDKGTRSEEPVASILLSTLKNMFENMILTN